MEPHAELILRRLSQARKRALAVLVVRHGSSLLVYGALGFVVLGLLNPGVGGTVLATVGPRGLVSAAGLWLLLASGLAFLLARLRGPSLGDVAQELDRWLGLEQRLETAAGLLEARDEVSALLRRDAAQRIERLDLRRLYPIQLGLGPWALRIATAILVAAALLLRGTPWPEIRGPARGLVAGAKEARQTESAVATEGLMERRAGESVAEERPGVASPVGSPAPDLAVGLERRPSRPRDSAAVMRTDTVAEETRGPETPSWPPGERDGPEVTGAGAEPAPSRASEPQGTPAIAAQVPQASAVAPPSGRPPSTTADEGSLPAPSPGWRVGARRGAGSPVEPWALGEGGAAEPAAAGPVTGSAGGPPGADEVESETRWTASEEALARERFPPGLRRYVRDYFLAIRRGRES